MLRKKHSLSNGMQAGMSDVGLLQVAFIVLKLCKVIDWSWWWVLAPTWITLLLCIVVFIVSVIVMKND